MFAYAQAQGSQQMPQTVNPFLQILPILLIFFVFYFLLIRPQQKKQKAHEQMIASLKKNDEVITAGGIHGTVVNVKDATVVLKVDDNAKIEFQKSAIVQIKKQRKGESENEVS
ncbi:MAG: preprotein translocase subunit YajC [Candidatus Omnitrophica bacterium]|nr:preprotein translocase subunit YajC [Candidatus Omnitrophota bacterium]